MWHSKAQSNSGEQQLKQWTSAHSIVLPYTPQHTAVSSIQDYAAAHCTQHWISTEREQCTLQGAMWCETEQSVPAKLRAMHACSICSNVLQHRLNIFHKSSIAAVKHSNARALGRFPRWSQCMSLKTGHCRLLHASTVYFNSVDPLGMHELWHTDKALEDFTCRQTLASCAVWETIWNAFC